MRYVGPGPKTALFCRMFFVVVGAAKYGPYSLSQIRDILTFADALFEGQIYAIRTGNSIRLEIGRNDKNPGKRN